MAALLWLIAGIVLIVAEVVSGDLVLLMLGAAALAGAGAEALFGVTLLSAGVFAAVSIGLITAARPALKRRLHPGEHVKDNVAALVGQRATVLTTVDGAGGRVRLDGQEWSARTLDETQVLEPGTSVTVMQISGATAVVWADGL
ncbi:putative activity regulator of membrane protease YbbK [Actinokineospora spheciospongiae]|uniref:Putative activity regulator of membrane protease YbbK n=1 Tax=Actinokineospora spheciospongiae TaxID=909613 RepID=W7IH44_9PSEU|nr:NfeD family protein [Actinokineospora spheciospongiae]EWC59603.1 putative activity regulator of membrane protease YbbK [Actinokineospora spheciospongiae]PWW63536.1 membrane protein implicated in regulation of membrane protease activity [Actinokineospora spheciospongiae]